MYSLSDKAKSRLEGKNLDVYLITIYYGLRYYPNWISNPQNGSGNNLSNIKKWCININDIEIETLKGWGKNIDYDIDLVKAKISGVQFKIGGVEYKNGGFEKNRILFFFGDKIVIDVIVDMEYCQRLGRFGEIRSVEEYHESPEIVDILIKLNDEVVKSNNKFWKIKNGDSNKFTFIKN